MRLRELISEESGERITRGLAFVRVTGNRTLVGMQKRLDHSPATSRITLSDVELPGAVSATGFLDSTGRVPTSRSIRQTICFVAIATISMLECATRSTSNDGFRTEPLVRRFAAPFCYTSDWSQLVEDSGHIVSELGGVSVVVGLRRRADFGRDEQRSMAYLLVNLKINNLII